MSKLVLASTVVAALALAAFKTPVHPEREAVERAVLDYVEALNHVNPELIDRSVHRGLEKLGMWRPEESTEYRLPGKMTFDQLRDLASHWNAGGVRGDDLTHRIELLDVMDVTASAKLTADWGIDHMHLMKRDGRWQIVQVLWQSHPPGK